MTKWERIKALAYIERIALDTDLLGTQNVFIFELPTEITVTADPRKVMQLVITAWRVDDLYCQELLELVTGKPGLKKGRVIWKRKTLSKHAITLRRWLQEQGVESHILEGRP